ncbi:hypothetical protein AB0A70_23950 [Streptomyces morookaense]|uniref:hypothetical protein n=1 Tax=Streptomyces morookaense TaxID=1970 RepID=UPI0033E88B45
MSGDQPYASHDPAGVLLLSLAGIIAVLWLAIYGGRLLFRAWVRGTTNAFVKAAASFGWAAAVGMYTWWLLRLFFFDETEQARACHAAIGTERLTGYAPSFIPLHFGCRTSSGHVAEALIPAYVNPAVVLLVACAIILTGFAITHRQEEKK